MNIFNVLPQWELVPLDDEGKQFLPAKRRQKVFLKDFLHSADATAF